MFFCLGKVGITVCNCLSMWLILQSMPVDEQACSLFAPFCVVGSFTYLTASVFLSVYDTAVLALMTCLAMDLDLNGNKPKFGPPTFHEAISNIEAR